MLGCKIRRNRGAAREPARHLLEVVTPRTNARHTDRPGGASVRRVFSAHACGWWASGCAGDRCGAENEISVSDPRRSRTFSSPVAPPGQHTASAQ